MALGLAAGALLDFSHFSQFFFEQDQQDTFIHLGGPAVLYVGFVTALTLPLRDRLQVDVASGLAALAITLLAFVVGLTLFEAAALYFRADPPGVGWEKTGEAYESFVRSAEVGFLGVYVATLLIAAGIGRLLGGWRLVPVVLAVTVAFLALSLPFAEFENACNIGEPVLLASNSC